MISSLLAAALLGAAPSPALAVPCPTTTLPVPLDRWRLEVFNNRSLTGSPVEARYDAGGSGGFAFDWGSGRGSECTGVDNWVAGVPSAPTKETLRATRSGAWECRAIVT